ncbi:malonyl-ACP O-methyltransferase BioC [Marinobacter nanhaiticus D15-8W]|uniref:Malonyl-[acyl-carrier protein] O-methyltransferase n=1 Tax=Marinobacter nanhaiticus D15-8W TaxID=626887 RepID=N6VZK1_9GAMM|nr:malonyl-ACP O-methyltransferase BioC [Marinobacter nanhaiticus]ENO13324.1 malonyl-[acyl-carrier protein] O-methyltransferase BioC [Marinobacter nanhaiticus D15-8W]BES70692.1 malonyl-ACP O-methyltransferase BioC [Marinobacter nanhaiticus D15-8W]
MNVQAFEIFEPSDSTRIYSRGDKASIARDFGAAATSYDRAARLQREMGAHLLGVMPEDSFTNVTDLGCGTGLFLEALSAKCGSKNLTAIDLSPAMLAHAKCNRNVDASWVCAAAESVPLPDDSQDLVFSNLMIQWCDDPEAVLRECQRILRPGGWLLCSTLLDGTLRELQQTWDLVDPGVPHVNRFEAPDRFSWAVDNVFPGARIDNRCYHLTYDHPSMLLRELKDLGAHHKSSERRTSMTGARRLKQLYRLYPRTNEGVLASYEAGFVVARHRT